MASAHCALGLYLCFILYLLLGGGIFYLSEQFYNDEHNITHLNAANSTTPSVLTVTNVWDFFAGTFLATTIVTTVGYGNFVPHTTFGKVFTIIYGTVGIPIAGIVLARFSDNFGMKLLKFYETERQRITNETVAIIIAGFLFVFSGFGVFMFLPAAIFSAIEGWEYLDSFYFAFVTLTTIGFGDIVAAQHGDISWLWLYRLLTLVWQFLGIGYWLVVAQFITKALQSKRIRIRFKRAKSSLSAHSREIKSVLEEHSPTKKPDFVPQKSKVIMDFLFHFGATMSEVETNHQHTYITGINALMDNKRAGVAALFNLPIAMVTRNSQSGPPSGTGVQKNPEPVTKQDKGLPCGSPTRKKSMLSLSSFNIPRTPSSVSAISTNEQSTPGNGRKTSVFGRRKRSTPRESQDWMIESIDPVKCLAVLQYLLESIYELDDNRMNDIVADCIKVVSDENEATSDDDGIEVNLDRVRPSRSDCEDTSEQKTTDSLPSYESACKMGACFAEDNCKFCVDVTATGKGRYEKSTGTVKYEELNVRSLKVRAESSQESLGVQGDKAGSSLKISIEKFSHSKAETKRHSVKFEQEKNNNKHNETTKLFSRFVQVRVENEKFDTESGKDKQIAVVPEVRTLDEHSEVEEMTDFSTGSGFKGGKRPMERRRRFGVTSVASVDSGCDFSEENEISLV